MSEKLFDVETVDCPSCGPASYTVWLEQEDATRYIQCHSCGTIFASPRASHASRYAWLKDTFSLDEFTRKIIENRRRALALEANILKAHIQGGKLLDIGCSTGVFFEYFDSGDWEKYGVELSPSTAAYAAQTYGADVRAGTLQSAHFPDGAFDLITMIDMFYYEDSPQETLREAARVICPDGLLAIELPGQAFHRLRGQGLICRLLDHRRTRFNSRSEYLYWYSPAGIQKLLNLSGFDAIRWEVISAPKRSGLSNQISLIYFWLIRFLVKFWPRAISWAPKYMVLAKVRKPGARIYS